MGIKVKVVPVYKTTFPSKNIDELRILLHGTSPDMITFTSSSTVTNFVKLAGKGFDLDSYKYASIGPVTAETATKAGLKITVNAEESTLDSLAKEISKYFSNKKPAAGSTGFPE